MGFAMNIGVCSITAAELWGIFEGLSIAWELGFRKVQVESNSRCAVGLINKNGSSLHKHSQLLSAIQELV